MNPEPNLTSDSPPGLTLAEEHLVLALSAGRVGTWELKLNKKPLLLLSTDLQRMLGLTNGKFDGTLKTMLSRVYPKDRLMLRKHYLNAIRQRSEAELEFRFVREGDVPGWLLSRAQLHYDSQGAPACLIGVCIDTSSRESARPNHLRRDSQLESQLARRMAQLHATEKELESFCYSVSHDLRAPLRSVRGFNEVLLERHAASLDPRGQEFLRRACQASQHMDRLIDGLLKLSRIGRTELSRRWIDLSQLASEIAAELAAIEPARCATFKITPGLQTLGDERLLRIVLEHLLRNAWKFTSKQSQTFIEVGATKVPESAFFVRDNGVGFDPEFAGRLFGVFQRLHPASEFPGGVGVGLAVVQRIITRHGGRVWASGTVGHGAKFFFSIPSDETF